MVVPRLQRLDGRVVRGRARPARRGRRAPDAGPARPPREEAHRIRDLGLVGGFCRPNAYNDRHFHHQVYTPVWEALEETGLPLALHPAGLADMPGASTRCSHLMAPGTHHALILQFDEQMTLSNLVYGGVLEQHPGLKVAVLECGGGWIGHWMDRMDEFLESYRWAAAPISLEPSEYFRRQCWISFDPGERTAGPLGPLVRCRPLRLGVRLPAQRREVPGRGRRAARAQRRAPRRRRAPGLYGLQRARPLRPDPHRLSAWRSTSSDRGAAPSSTAPARPRARPTSRSTAGASSTSATSTRPATGAR